MAEETYQTTKEGLENLVKELKHRKKVVRKKIGNTLGEMRAQGDLSENDGYTMAVEEQNINEEKIRELREKIKNVEIVKKGSKGKVGIGNTVTLKNSKEIQYEITSEDEANPLEGKISHKSPIGEAIIGKKAGEKVVIETPKGETEYTIKKIS
jgi:transcription elongation factor GreA